MESRTGAIEILPVPDKVNNISIIVGVPCPQDGDSKRSVIVSADSEAFFGSGDTFIEVETEGLNNSKEDDLVAQIISKLGEQGFTEISRQVCVEFGGFFACLQRG